MSAPPSTPVTPVPAATILLLRDGVDGLEVLMIERHGQSTFAAGAMVFPGGKVDPADRQLCEYGAADDQGNDLLPRVAAIREAYEECGVLLARPRGSRALMSAADVHAFHAHQEKAGSFVAAVAAAGIALATDLLVPIAHWITPAASPKRFDTQFFVAPGLTDQVARQDGFEAVDAVWITPQAAVAAADEGSRYLMLPTYLILRDISRDRTVADVLETARKRTIVTVMPEFTLTEKGKVTRIPPDVGYDLAGIPAAQFLTR